MRLLLIILACTLGCWSSNDPTYQLAGTAWVQRIPDRECEHKVGFAEDGQYLDTMYCVLGDYSEAIQVNKGTFGVGDWTLTVNLTQSSCPTNSSGSVEFSVSGDRLNIFTAAGGTLTMTRLIFPPDIPDGVMIGCFHPDTWLFTPMAIHAL
jgi:hypothetical protein